MSYSYRVYDKHPQKGPLTIYPYLRFHSNPAPPVQLWEEYVQDRTGEIRRSYDDDLVENLLIVGQNVMRTCIKCPVLPYKSLGIRHPVLTLTIGNIGRVYTFDVRVLDTLGGTWLFRVSNGSSRYIRYHEHCCFLPAPKLVGWIQLAINLRDLLRSAYAREYAEAVSVQLYATCRLQKIQFTPDHKIVPFSKCSSESSLDDRYDASPPLEVIRAPTESVISVDVLPSDTDIWQVESDSEAGPAVRFTLSAENVPAAGGRKGNQPGVTQSLGDIAGSRSREKLD